MASSSQWPCSWIFIICVVYGLCIGDSIAYKNVDLTEIDECIHGREEIGANEEITFTAEGLIVVSCSMRINTRCDKVCLSMKDLQFPFCDVDVKIVRGVTWRASSGDVQIYNCNSSLPIEPEQICDDYTLTIKLGTKNRYYFLAGDGYRRPFDGTIKATAECSPLRKTTTQPNWNFDSNSDSNSESEENSPNTTTIVVVVAACLGMGFIIMIYICRKADRDSYEQSHVTIAGVNVPDYIQPADSRPNTPMLTGSHSGPQQYPESTVPAQPFAPYPQSSAPYPASSAPYPQSSASDPPAYDQAVNLPRPHTSSEQPNNPPEAPSENQSPPSVPPPMYSELFGD